jgi:hypothetical protein
MPHRLPNVLGDVFEQPGGGEHGVLVGVVLGPAAVSEQGVAMEPDRGGEQRPGLLGPVVAGVGVVADALDIVGDVDEGAADDSFLSVAGSLGGMTASKEVFVGNGQGAGAGGSAGSHVGWFAHGQAASVPWSSASSPARGTRRVRPISMQGRPCRPLVARHWRAAA